MMMSSNGSVSNHHNLARFLVCITIMMVFANLFFLTPLDKAISLHENHYFFSEENHMHRASSPSSSKRSRHNFKSNSTKNSRPSSLQNSAAALPVQVPQFDFTEEQGRQYIHDIFKEAGVTLTPEMEAQLPSWKQVQQVVGTHPYILNLQSCSKYRDHVPPLERMLGSSGMFNTGTNLVTHLLKQNCEIPERREKYGPHESKESYGMRWQVPWGKHTSAKFRLEHATEKASAIRKDYILPVVTIRHPYSWFKSMCKNGYTAKWDHGKTKKDGILHNCPNLKNNLNEWTPVTVTFADDRQDHHSSLAHLWNDWYSYYIDQADYPFVVVRMEDLVFYPKETTKLICECAGGKIRTDQDNFQFIVDSAKADSPGHDKSTGIYAAWVKYSKPPPRKYGFTDEDYEAAKEALNGELMEALGYQHPPA